MSDNNRAQNRQFWQNKVLEWQESGLSQADYCRKHNLKPNKLCYYKSLFLAPKMAPSLVPVATATPAMTPGVVTVILPEGVRLEVPTEQFPALLPCLIDVIRTSL